MNREIKFRGLSDCGYFIYGDLLHNAFDGVEFHEAGIAKRGCYPEKVNPKTVGQFTGLTDKNGKEIYEGDILLCKTNCMFDDGSRKKCVVEFSGGSFKCDGMSLPMLIIDFDAEVIGNIHQNPELLK